MGLIEDAIQDAADFTSNSDEFGVSIALVAPTGETATINGFSTKHHLKLDKDSGMVVNSKNASVAISERKLLEINPDYPIRNNNPASDHYQEVQMRDNKVDVADSSGVVKKFICIEVFSDEALGLIILILGDYKAA